MATWHEIREHARSKFKLAKDEKDFFSLVFGYAGDRAQLVIVQHFRAFEQDFVMFISPVCKLSDMPAGEALRKNDGFAVGAIARDGDMYVMKYSVPLKNRQIEEFELPLLAVARTADMLEQKHTARDQF